MANPDALAEATEDAIRVDNWINLYSSLGSAMDRTSARQPKPTRGIQRSEIDRMYRGDAISRRVCDLVTVDAMRSRFRLSVREVQPGQAIDAQESNEISEAAIARFDELKAWDTIRKARKLSRLYGGSALFFGSAKGDDIGGHAKPWTEGEPLEFLLALNRFQVTLGDPDSEIGPNLGEPISLQILNVARGSTDADGSEWHHTRARRFQGIEIPADVDRADTGVSCAGLAHANDPRWGDPVFLSLWDAIAGLAMAYAGADRMIDDFSQMIYSMKNLRAIATAEGKRALQSRLQILSMGMSMVNIAAIDGEENLSRQSHNVSGYPDLIDRFMVRLSAGAGMSLTRLFGVSPGGFGTGESEAEDWSREVSTERSEQIAPAVRDVMDRIFASPDSPTGGVVPARYSIEFDKIREETAIERAQIRAAVVDASVKLVGASVLSPEEVAESLYGTGEFSMEIQLDREARDLLAAQDEADDLEPDPEVPDEPAEVPEPDAEAADDAAE